MEKLLKQVYKKLQNYIDKYRPPMKLGVAYNLFDGEELLEASINCIRSEASYICVIYQTTSYWGNEANPNITKFLDSLKRKKLIDDYFLFEKENIEKIQNKHKIEAQKRDFALKMCKKAGCTHFLNIDVDEFYDTEQFKNAKNFILRNNIKSSACSIYEYLREPIYRIVDDYLYTTTKPYNFYVPFIMKINRFKPQKHKKFFPTLADPTRGLNGKEKFYLFPVQDIVMHHMSTTRKDLCKKYANSNLQGNAEFAKTINNLIKELLEFNFDKNSFANGKYSLFRDKIIEKVENKFNIKLED